MGASPKDWIRMKRLTATLVIASFSAIASFVVAGDFRSAVIKPAGDSLSLDVPDAQFLTIRNFTQEGGAQRGVVTVTANGQTTMSWQLLSSTKDHPFHRSLSKK